ncbi:MAG: hypothetical protein GY858_04685 [Candidatus Omnitrophica bacterium]|nr:hypothetical protein [Candidatus Omnitrophota bacterium]
MSINFAGLTLNNPYLAASGCFGYGGELENIFQNQKWGGCVSKTITVEKRDGNPPPRIFETEGGIINRIGLQNCGLTNFLSKELPRIKNLPYPVIVSIFGNTIDEWKTLLTTLEENNVPAVELNLSCPNLKGEVVVRNIDLCTNIVRELKKISGIPVIAKINAIYSPVELSCGLKEAGIDGIVCSNTFPAGVYHNGKFYEGGLSGPAIKPVVLKTIFKIKENVDIDLAACGGIWNSSDIEDYRSAGARAFVLGSVLLTNPDTISDFTTAF